MALWDNITAPKGYHLYREHEGTALGIPVPASGPLADLFALETDYILEMYIPGEDGMSMFHSAVALPLPPESMQISRDAATQITPTLGYLPIREHSLTRQLSIRMRGRSGVATRQGHDRKGAIVTKSGPDLVREFDAFLDKYQRTCHDYATHYRNPSTAARAQAVSMAGPYLVFRSFSNGLHVRCEPRNWTLTRDVQQSRFGFTWFLDLQAYAPATPTSPPGLFSKVGDVMAFVSELIYAAATTVAVVGTTVNRATELANSGRAALQAAATACASFGDVMSSVRGVSQIPDGYLADVANIVTEAQTSVAGFIDAQRAAQSFGDPAASRAPPTDDEIAELEDTLGQLTKTAVSAITLCGMIGGQVTVAARGAEIERPPAGAVAISDMTTAAFRRRPGLSSFALTQESPPIGAVVPLPDFGSLETLAQRYYGARRLWTRIATANRMRGAYTLADGSPLVPGTLLLVPLSNSQLARAQSSPGQDMHTDAMATDLYLDTVTGDLEISGSGLDVRLAREAENLEQAIRMRLLSTQGSSSCFPAWGLPELIGTEVGAGTLGFLASHLNDQLLRDPRILEVTRVALSDEGDQLAAVVECQPITGQSLQVVAPV
jgi:hypothetical protein